MAHYCCCCLSCCVFPCVYCYTKRNRQFCPKELKNSRSEVETSRYNHPPPRPKNKPNPKLLSSFQEISADNASVDDDYSTFEAATSVPTPKQAEDPPVLYSNRFIWQNPYTVEEFYKYIDTQLRGKKVGLVKEFEALKVLDFRYQSDEAMSMENRKKNIHDVNFIPYDLNRVKLSKDPNYVNASTIPGNYWDGVTYVIAEHPSVTSVVSTLGDFWQMVWEQNVRCIVSLTSEIVSGDTEKGAYWPKEKGKDQEFAFLHVKLTNKTKYEYSTHRTFIVSLEEDKRKSFLLHHIEFSSSIDELKVPAAYLIILSLVHQISDVMGNKDPNAKLCFVSKGSNSLIGIFIVLFEVVKAIQDKIPFSIYLTTDHLLDHRAGLITQYEHYKMIYIATLEFLQELKPINLVDFKQVDVGKIDQESDEESCVQLEYNKVNKFCEKAYFMKPHSKSDSQSAKTQITNTFPYDDNIVDLLECPTGNDYINASYVQMESGICPIIATVHPTKKNIGEFFWMLISNQVEYVFVFAKAEEIELMKEGLVTFSYWSPNNLEKSFGEFHVQRSTVGDRQGMLKYILKIAYIPAIKERIEHNLQLCVYQDWDEDDLPSDSKGFLDVVQYVEDFRMSERGTKPVVFHSIDGSTKIGILLAVMNGCSQIKRGEEVDVPWIVKNLRHQRMKMIDSREEYQKCYQLLIEFAKMQ